ncbi:hypothetical protein [Leisingera methylohalidivorans]|uniref:Membrane protein n=1 Tax=Leisingera methylohalidivorans DSM 14336 TaxID=999552 RepID=V9VY80_9RHOB|nr:hypothetical protein [Leisingera methylohalidivorans]AHD02689.1 membrane protein [Leisingera methylohalidivorans DSM 14336]
MHAIADTNALVEEGILTPDQAREIEGRSREVMVLLAVNAVLFFGIIATTAGFIFWLADPLAVAVTGILMLGGGLAVLARGKEILRMFGNSATLIGAGMLMGGAGIELADKYEDFAGWVMLPAGALVAAICVWRWRSGAWSTGFVLGTILLMGLAMHLAGIELLLQQYEIGSPIRNIVLLYYTLALGLAGWQVDVRFVTALAIAPFAQMLETGTGYFHAAYVFYSPESTLTILQMVLLILLCVWGAARLAERDARHLRVLAILGFVVANLCALVGSLWGDVVGETVWGPGRYSDGYADWDAYATARDAFRDSALFISEGVYSVLWAAVLAAVIFWAAQRHQRGLFNAALTFAAIHAYTQMFESFADEPLAYVVGGLAAIPLAWGLWRLNQWMAVTQA